jgi:hypothetical protein
LPQQRRAPDRERRLGAADGRARFASPSPRTLTANQSPADFQLTRSAGRLKSTLQEDVTAFGCVYSGIILAWVRGLR